MVDVLQARQTEARTMPAAAPRYVHLDMLRGLAALAVVVGHVRGFVLMDYGQLQAPPAWNHIVYFAGGLGHQSVIAFFALSGFLVGGKALTDLRSNRFVWTNYMVARLARLWTVVLPALILTLALDIAGRMLGSGLGYDGSLYGILSSGPSREAPLDHTLPTLLANILFLQTIAAPVYGSNGPLWSLANEFWYYIVFPLFGYSVLARGAVVMRLVAGLAALVLAALLPLELMLLGLIWLAGAAAHHLTEHTRLRPLFSKPAYCVAALLTVAAAVVAGFRWHSLSYDLLLGFAWAAALPALAMLPAWRGHYQRAASGLSEISYTLYATHFPLLAFLYFVWLAPAQWPPGPHVLLIGFGLVAASLAIAAVLWWCFERNTGKVRAAATGLLKRRES